MNLDNRTRLACREDAECNVLYTDAARLEAENECLDERLSRLQRGDHDPLSPADIGYLHRTHDLSLEQIKHKILPSSRPHCAVEMAVFGWWVDTGQSCRLADLPVFMEEVFQVSETEAADLIEAALNDWSHDRVGVFICPREWMEEVLDEEIPAPPPEFVGRDIVTDFRVFVSAEAQVRGDLADRWHLWSLCRMREVVRSES